MVTQTVEQRIGRQRTVGLDQGQSQINTRSDSCRGEDMPLAVATTGVIGVQAIAVHLDLREA